MNRTRWVLAGLGASAVIFALDFLIHEKLLMGLYEQTAAVWRPQAEANQLMWLMMVGTLLFGLAFAWFYTRGYEKHKSGLGQGVRFGFYVGLILVAYQHLVWFIVLPIPLVLSLSWLVPSESELVLLSSSLLPVVHPGETLPSLSVKPITVHSLGLVPTVNPTNSG